MPKKINIKMPNVSNKTQDEWVNKGKETDFIKNQNKIVKMKRLTIDISEELHSQIKVYCAKKGLKMADEIRRILKEKFRG